MYYHVWFVTKYRRITLKGEIEKFVKDILAECIARHNYRVLELETNKDHLHMLVETKDKKHLVALVRTLKAISAKEILQTPYFRMGNVRHFWARRYGYKEIKETEIESIGEYIRNQKKIPHSEECGKSLR